MEGKPEITVDIGTTPYRYGGRYIRSGFICYWLGWIVLSLGENLRNPVRYFVGLNNIL